MVVGYAVTHLGLWRSASDCALLHFVMSRNTLSTSSDLFIPHDKLTKFNTTNAEGFGRRINKAWDMSKENKICSYKSS